MRSISKSILWGICLTGWIAQFGFVSFAHSDDQQPEDSDLNIKNIKCDIVIVDSGLGGVAAAAQAARSGAKTCMTSMTNWLGGQMTVGGVPDLDLPYQFSDGDLEFLNKYATKIGDKWVVTGQEHIGPGTYVTTRPHEEEVLRTFMQALGPITRSVGCWGGRFCYTPLEANQAFKDFLAPYIQNGTLRIFYETVPKRATLEGSQINSVDFVHRQYTGWGPKPYEPRLSQEVQDWYTEKDSLRYAKQIYRLSGKIFIDASETGELIALSGANHRLGNVASESPVDRPYADDHECVQGFVDPMAVIRGKADPDTQSYLDSIQNPPGLEAFSIRQGSEFKFWNDDTTRPGLSVFDYRRMSNDPAATALNWNPGNDYSKMNFILPVEKLGDQAFDWKGGLRIEALEEAERRSLAFTGWLTHQPEVMWDNRNITPVRSLDDPRNYFNTGTGLSKFPYVRESRRMEGYQGFYILPDETTTSSRALGVFPDAQYSNFYDSIGVGSYPLDGRPCPSKWVVTYPKRFGNHYQIPLRALVSSNISNLLAANKTLAVTQVTNATYRLHPTEWNTGFGAGTAAAVAFDKEEDLHELMANPVHIRKVQTEVLRWGGRVLWFSDELPPESAH